jgi:hypothetical protein
MVGAVIPILRPYKRRVNARTEGEIASGKGRPRNDKRAVGYELERMHEKIGTWDALPDSVQYDGAG